MTSVRSPLVEAPTKAEGADGILVTAAIRDISVRKAVEKHLAELEDRRGLAEEALRQSEERYRMLLDGIQDYAIFMMDLGGQIVSWNAGAERMKGYRAEQIIGHHFSCFFPPEDIERGRPEEVLRMTAARGRHEEQGMRVRKDGSRFLANVTFTALCDPDGNLRGFSEFSHDISKSKASEAKYRGLLEAAPDAMVVVNQDGAIVLLNVQAEKQFGYPRDELIGQPVTTIIPEGFAERLVADGLRSVEEALAQQIGTGIELTGRRKDGSEFPIELMLSPLESTDGILVTAAIRDISVRKAADKHLAQMEGRYRGLLEAAPDAMVVVNQDGAIVLLNVQAEKQFGYHRDALLGQPVKNLIPEGFAERLVADGLRSVEEALAQQIGTGIELTGRRKDGSEFPIELMLSPLESTDGILVTAAIRDISVRKAADKHLAQMEGRYRGLLEAAPDAMVVVNQDGAIVLLNVQAEKQFGYHRDALLGQPVKNLIPEGFAERLVADGLRSVEEALAQQIGTGIELTGRRKDGSEFPIELMLSPLATEDGVLVSSSIRDVSDRKRFERTLQEKNVELEKASLAKDRFLANMSHELRTPLNAIIGFTGTLLMRLPGPLTADQEKQLRTVQTSGRHLLSLINDLLDLAKIESGTVELYLEPVPCQSVIQEVATALRPLAEGKGLAFDVTMAAADIIIQTDRRALSQILLNLTNNAIKFTEHGQVSLTLSQHQAEGQTCTAIGIRDTGIGIRPADQEQLFHAFTQVDASTTRRYEGTGLGLHLSQKLAALLGGQITFQSVYGTGSTFTLTLTES